MELDAIINKLSKRTPTILGSEHSSKYAILLPLVRIETDIHVLFEVRSHSLRRQPGEICFPGGKIDPEDENAKAAAIRETIEELRVNSDDIVNVFPLDYMVSPFGMMIYPFAGIVHNYDHIKPNQSEVAEVFTVPISHFLTKSPDIYHINFKMEPEENFPFDLIPGGEHYKWRTRAMDEYFYQYKGKVIWGLTAKLLAHFIDLIR